MIRLALWKKTNELILPAGMVLIRFRPSQETWFRGRMDVNRLV